MQRSEGNDLAFEFTPSIRDGVLDSKGTTPKGEWGMGTDLQKFWTKRGHAATRSAWRFDPKESREAECVDVQSMIRSLKWIASAGYAGGSQWVGETVTETFAISASATMTSTVPVPVGASVY